MRYRWTLSEMKEIILSFLALLWGVLFLLPGETLSQASRIDLMSLYAGDNTWGIFLVVSSLFLLFSPRSDHLLFRRIAHAFLFLFWLAMFCIVFFRLVEDGIKVTDIHVSSVYVAIAFIHAAFYARTVYLK